MKILITGANGLVGSHFVENYPKDLKFSSIILSPDKSELDITNQKSVENFFKLNRPDVIIHFAAFTDVSAAEEQRGDKDGSCWTVNVEGTANLIRAINYQPYFIYISTDVVFSGNKDNPGPYAEGFPPEQDEKLLSWYGWTKKEAESLVSNNLENWAILRISNPSRAKYDLKLDYVRKILTLFDTGKLYPLFNDQYLTLTFIDEVTASLKILLQKRLAGFFHVSSNNIFTPFKLANLLIEKTRQVKNVVRPISIESFLKDNPARYPKYGGLKVEKTQQMLNLKFKSWEEIIEILATQL